MSPSDNTTGVLHAPLFDSLWTSSYGELQNSSSAVFQASHHFSCTVTVFVVPILQACCVASQPTQWSISFGVVLLLPWTKWVNRFQLKFANTFLCYQHSSKPSIIMKWVMACFKMLRLWWALSILKKTPSTTRWRLQYPIFPRPT